MKTEKENTDKEIEEIKEIRKLMQSLTFDDIADDYSIFTELVLKHHPGGMSLIEDLKMVKTDDNDSTYSFSFPTAIIEFRKFLGEKYNDHKKEMAISMLVLAKASNLKYP